MTICTGLVMMTVHVVVAQLLRDLRSTNVIIDEAVEASAMGAAAVLLLWFAVIRPLRSEAERRLALPRDLATQELLRRGESFALAMRDLDHFKRLNDTHGHDARDRAPRLFSPTLRAALPADDLVCRFGGRSS